MSDHTQSEEPVEFDEKIQNEIKKYVYRLIDPRTDKTFYVGKGTGNRVFAHAKDKKFTRNKDEPLGAKLDIIRDIMKEGKRVQYVIHRHGLSNKEAFHVEAALIDAYPDLTNAVGGHGSGDTGAMTARQIIIKYGLPVLETNPQHRLLLINIPKLDNSDDRDAIYDQVRYRWRIDKKRAEKADYVLAVLRGVVVGCFVAKEWLPSTKANFTDIKRADDQDPKRNGFVGTAAPPDIWERYVGKHGKRIEQKELQLKGQNPIRYWNF